MSDNPVCHEDQVPQLLAEAGDLCPEGLLNYLCRRYPGRVMLSSSLAAEDQVLTDLICRNELPVRIMTIDTGRLPEQTHQTLEQTRRRYGIDIEVFFPDYRQVESLTTRHGSNLFYRDIEFRKRCCAVRKIEPLQRALREVDCWICGLRQEQAVTRRDLPVIQFDRQFGRIKVAPLWNWTTQQVWEYIHRHQVPYNPLHDLGYPSIGCAPCTRAVRPGEDIRAGRWWWEQPEHKECGLHLDGRPGPAQT